MTVPAESDRFQKLLDGLLRCANCGRPMTCDSPVDLGEPTYGCRRWSGDDRSRCDTPSLRADALHRLVISQVMPAVLTPRNLAYLVVEISEQMAEETGTQTPQRGAPPGISQDEAKAVANDPETFLQPDRIADARRFLERFIEQVVVQPGRLIVSYSQPLPVDHELGRTYQQEIELPFSTTT